MRNVEVKAYLDDPALAQHRLVAAGMILEQDHIETDTYFDLADDRLKYRESNIRPPKLIGYRRPNDPRLRASTFQIAAVQGSERLIFDLLSAELGVKNVISKHRRTYRDGAALVNIDCVFDEYHFIEIEVSCSEGGATTANDRARSLMDYLHIEERDCLGQSYTDIANILSAAREWRRKLAPDLERLVLIDGPSGAGKSTLVSNIGSTYPGAAYVRRTTSRPRRPDDSEDEYEFISVKEFVEAERSGEFLESKEFLFDMRYGLRWTNIASALTAHRIAVGVMNLGNIRHVEFIAPEVTTVLITAPPRTLLRRILARGTHSSDAVEERLENARRVEALTDLYDHVIVNDDGDLEASLRSFNSLLTSVSRA